MALSVKAIVSVVIRVGGVGSGACYECRVCGLGIGAAYGRQCGFNGCASAIIAMSRGAAIRALIARCASCWLRG